MVRMPRLSLAVIVLTFSLTTAHARQAEECDVAGDVARLPGVMAEVQSSGASRSDCSSASSISFSQSSSRLGCPYSLIDRLSKDRRSGWLESSPSDACRVALSSARKASVSDIESRLSRDQLTSIGVASDFLQKACSSISPSVTEEDQKALAAEYYLDMNRLKQAELFSYETLASIDSLLGKKPLHDFKCGDSRLSELNRRCGALQACAPAGGLKEQAEELQQIWPLAEALEKKRRESEVARSSLYKAAAYGGRIDQESISQQEASIQEASQQLNLLQAMYPVIRGKEFRKTLDPKKGNFQ